MDKLNLKNMTPQDVAKAIMSDTYSYSEYIEEHLTQFYEQNEEYFKDWKKHFEEAGEAKEAKFCVKTDGRVYEGIDGKPLLWDSRDDAYNALIEGGYIQSSLDEDLEDETISIVKYSEDVIKINTVIACAKSLKSDGENKEYDRALVELVCDCYPNKNQDDKEEIAKILGIELE